MSMDVFDCGVMLFESQEDEEDLRVEYTGYDCFSRIRALLRRLVVPYAVYEAPIAR